MKTLIIKEGDFKKYQCLYDIDISKEISYLKINNSNGLVNQIQTKINLQRFGLDYCDFKNPSDIIKFYDNYYLGNKINDFEELNKIVIEEQSLDLLNIKSKFYKEIISKKDIEKIFKSDITINGSGDELLFTKFNFEKKLIINNLKARQISFKECVFDKLVLSDFDKVNLNSEEVEYLCLSFSNSKGKIEIKNNKIGKLEILDSKFTKIKINNNTFHDRVKISSTDGKINSSNHVDINFDTNDINNLRIGHGAINTLTINNIKNPKDSEINLGNIEIKSFTLSNIRNLGKIRLYDINKNVLEKKKTLININNSSFGDSEFQNINMKSFDQNKIYDNLFTDLKYTGVKWSDDIGVDGKEDCEKLRDTYRTLKNVAEKNNDSIMGNIFYRNEMDNHLKALNKINISSLFKKEWGFIDKIGIYGSSIGDKVVLRFSAILNDFGTNWIMNLVWLFVYVYLATYIRFIFTYESANKMIDSFSGIYVSSQNYDNILLQSFFIVSILVILSIIFYWFVRISLWLMEKFHIIFLFTIFISIYFLYGYEDIFNDYMNLLINPLYGFKDLLSDEGLKGIKLLGFIIYKVFYIIIMWHLLVAIKRTTKR